MVKPETRAASVRWLVLALVLAALIVLGLALAVQAANPASDFTYVEGDSSVTITGYVGSATTVVVPSEINGKPATAIGDWAFASCTSLTSVTLPGGITSIGDSAFRNCTSLTSASLPEGVASIGSYLFYDCTSLTSVTLPGTVISIGRSFFSGCTSLTSIALPEGITAVDDSAFRNCISLTSITLPESVTSIGSYLFYDCTSLTSITLPSAVTSIGRYLFSGCTSLTSIALPEGVTSIDRETLDGCTSLVSIAIPSTVTSIGYNAFTGFTSLTSITLPEGVTSIGHEAFWHCTSLTSVTLPESLTSIGGHAFNGCTSLSSVAIPKGVSSISIGTFWGCASLTSITIAEGMTSIGDWAFASCTSLTSVTLPEGLTSIGVEAFSGCTALTTVTYPYPYPQGASIDGSAFARCPVLQATITFQTNGGSLVSSITQGFNTSVTAPPDPRRAGYTFAGWYFDEALSKPAAVPAAMPLSNVTLHAKWAYIAPVTSTCYDQTDENIVKTGNWTDFTSTAAYKGTYGRASTSGATATVWFTGTRIAWIGMKGVTPGIVDVYIDDVWKAKLDLYASPAQYQVPLWTSPTLPNGTHHMDLVRNEDSLSTEFLVLDAVDIWGNIQAAPPAITSLSPASGSTVASTAVVINGTSFTGATSVTFGGTSLPFTVVSFTKITVTAPAHAAGSIPVQVTTAAGTASSTFTYTVALPTTRLDVKKTTTTTTPGSIWSGTWSSYMSPSAFGGSYLRSSTAGAYVLIVFKGTRFDWISMKGTTGGIADIYVDGSSTKAATINLYRSPAVYQQTVWSTGTLPDGYHTVKIVRSSSSASGRYLTIDAVEVAGKLVAVTRTEDKPTPANPTPFLWTPSFDAWTTMNTSSASGGTYKYINTANASITFNFTGVSLSIIAKTASNYGNLTVTVDGVSKTVSLYSSSPLYRKTVWSSGFLRPGNHTVVIKRAGTKSASSSGYSVNFDAADLRGEWR